MHIFRHPHSGRLGRGERPATLCLRLVSEVTLCLLSMISWLKLFCKSTGSAIFLAHDGKTVAELNLQNSGSDLTLESSTRTTSKEDVGSANEAEKRGFVIPREMIYRGPTYRKFLVCIQKVKLHINFRCSVERLRECHICPIVSDCLPRRPRHQPHPSLQYSRRQDQEVSRQRQLLPHQGDIEPQGGRRPQQLHTGPFEFPVPSKKFESCSASEMKYSSRLSSARCSPLLALTSAPLAATPSSVTS